MRRRIEAGACLPYRLPLRVRTQPGVRYRQGRSFRGALAALLVALLPAGPIPRAFGGADEAPAPVASSNAPTSVDAVRVLLSKWVETEQLIAKESREAQQTKDILAERVDMLKESVASMNEKIAQADEKLAQAQKQKIEVTALIEQNTIAAARIAGDVVGLEAGVRTLNPRLPTPLKEKIRTLYERMPADTNSVRVSVAERCQNVLGILNEINKFDAEIVLVYDVRNLSDGKPSEVTCVYVGLGQAYSISPRGEAAAGRPGPRGWEWTPLPASSEAIALTLDILQNKAKPTFVSLPAELQK